MDRPLPYNYDNIGQLRTAVGKEASGAGRMNENFGYIYDAGGNLNQRTNDALTQTFTVNNLNELSTGTRSGTLTVAGTTTAVATNVTVNSLAATLYSDQTFAKNGFSLTNGNNSYSAIAQDSYGRKDTNTVSVNLPSSVSYIYDLNGNLTSDGTRGFDYDDENQLIRITVTNTWKSEFSYDGRMRRRIRKEFTWQNSAWAQTAEVHYIYDGMLVIQERDANNLPTVTYTRGRDLSGSLQGAGGIGGLLARTDAANGQSACYHADGNGNVTAMVNSQQIVVAKYTYDPFGNILSKSGQLAEANTYRFSSQECHQPSGLSLYLYRAYDPNLQRWLNRDPLEEEGGINLYGYVYNSPVNLVDPYGLLAPSPLFTLIATTGRTAAAVAITGESAVVILAVSAPFVVGADVYQMSQIRQLNQQNQQAAQYITQKRKDYDAYKDKCKDVNPPPGLNPCELARWQLQRKQGCKQGREDFANKYYGGIYDWGHQRYMDILNGEIRNLEDWIKQNCKPCP